MKTVPSVYAVQLDWQINYTYSPDVVWIFEQCLTRNVDIYKKIRIQNPIQSLPVKETILCRKFFSSRFLRIKTDILDCIQEVTFR